MIIKKFHPVRKTLLILSICLVLPFANARAQGGITWAFHMSSPTGLLSKVRIKAEMRIDTFNSLLLCYTRFWGLSPGNMLGAEYRRYGSQRRRSENYIYGEVGAAHYDYIGGFDHTDSYDIHSDAVFVGAGVGRHFNFNHFFLDLAGGLRGTATSPLTSDPIFYMFGPGAIVRINGTFGFQFPARTYKQEHHHVREEF